MKTKLRYLSPSVLALPLLFGLPTIACGPDKDDNAEEAGEKVDEAVDDAADSTEDAAEDVGDKVEDATD
jgi:hypothetical protein